MTAGSWRPPAASRRPVAARSTTRVVLPATGTESTTPVILTFRALAPSVTWTVSPTAAPMPAR
ncbi:hypothetical protein ACFQ0M_04475 [Kitasatospora aburaviensis]